jgi:hypothetical protein
MEAVVDGQRSARVQTHGVERELGASFRRHEWMPLELPRAVGRDAVGVGHAGGHRDTIRGPLRLLVADRRARPARLARAARGTDAHRVRAEQVHHRSPKLGAMRASARADAPTVFEPAFVDDHDEPALRRPAAPQREVDPELAVVACSHAQLGRAAAGAATHDAHLVVRAVASAGARRREEDGGDEGEHESARHERRVQPSRRCGQWDFGPTTAGCRAPVAPPTALPACDRSHRSCGRRSSGASSPSSR